jgi:starch-binding outer membrane protein, SusD/RagB family
MLTTSCDDMLTPDMERYAGADKFAQDSVYGALGVLRSIQNVAERTIILDASRSDMVTSGTYTTDSINDIANFNNPADGSSALCNVADYYHIVNSCNFYLANVDTVTTTNGKKQILDEWAQVQAMRAWAYIQLVRNYGEVPFVTTPVGSTSEAESLAKSAGKVNASNLATLLVQNGLDYAYVLQRKQGMPNYGSFNNGDKSYNSQNNMFPVELMLADAYLMGNDYANAAKYYYEYFTYDCSSTPKFNVDKFSCSTSDDHRGGESTKYVNSGKIGEIFSDGLGDNITSATSATTPSAGKTLTQVQNVFGFKTTISGTSITCTPNEQYMQLIPSNQFVTTSTAQNYNSFSMSGDVVEIESVEPGDGRYMVTAPRVSLKGGSVSRMVCKYINTDNYQNENGYAQINNKEESYHIQLYRVPLAVLRYAEAINRLGFPELAFGILKDGLFTENLPTTYTFPRYDEALIVYHDKDDETVITSDTIRGIIVGKINISDRSTFLDSSHDSTLVVYEDANGNKRYVGDFIPYEPHDSVPGIAVSDLPASVTDTLFTEKELMSSPQAYTGGMYYLSFDELKNMSNYTFLDFSGAKWSVDNCTDESVQGGIHARGCGDVAGKYDTVYTYAKQVAAKLAEEHARQNNLTYEQQLAYAKTLYSGDNLLVTDKAAIQNAVENIIVDELALETAFEGNRYGDLIRIAGHKNLAGFDGNDWFAWKIARRDYNFTDDANKFDAILKAKLLNTSNWYLSLPK